MSLDEHQPYPESFSLVSGNAIALWNDWQLPHPPDSTCPKGYVFIGMAVEIEGLEHMGSFMDELDADLGVENFRMRATIQVGALVNFAVRQALI